MAREAREGLGVNCPICQQDTIVLTTAAPDRRRKCTACGHRFTTVEVVKEEHQRLQDAVDQVRQVAERLKDAA